MKYKFNYGSEVISLPGSAAQYIGAASKDKIRVLFSLAAEPAMTAKKRAESLGMTEEALAAAIAYWSAVEVISPDKSAPVEKDAGPRRAARASGSSRKNAGGTFAVEDGSAADTRSDSVPASASADAPAPSSKASAKPGRDAEQNGVTALFNDTPHMTTRELTGAASDADNARLLEHCQQLMGRVFNAAEAERIVAVRSYLGVSTDFIALVCDHLKKEGRLTVRGLENFAIELHDGGIADFDSLVDYFERREKARTFEAKVRSLYGLGSRALSSAEKKIVEKWASLGFGEDMISFAYELTVNTTESASLKYSNAIIEKWAADGVKSLDEAKKREEEFRSRTQSKGQKSARSQKAKKPENETVSSFKTGDFFEQALLRSYGGEFYDKVLKGNDAEGDENAAGNDSEK